MEGFIVVSIQAVYQKVRHKSGVVYGVYCHGITSGVKKVDRTYYNSLSGKNVYPEGITMETVTSYIVLWRVL